MDAMEKLLRIESLALDCQQRKWAHEDAKAAASAAKQALDAAHEALTLAILEPHPKPLPLLNGIATDATSSSPSAGPSDGLTAGDCGASPQRDDAWKAEPIEALGLPAKSVNEPLIAAGVTTLGKLAAWTEPDERGVCKQLADIPGIGKGRAEKIENAVVAWWERRRAGEADT